MCKIATWSIVNNEIDFIKDILDYHLSWVDFMYFLDTGSTDGTLEILKDYARADARVYVEEYPEKFIPQYELAWQEMKNPFPEVNVRNHALESVSKIGADWLIQLDGDEIFTSETRDVINNNNNFICIGHSTINPICKLEEHPKENRGGYILNDPHVRIWQNNKNVFYMENPAFAGHQYHCVPTIGNTKSHLLNYKFIKFVDNPIHFHLHWMYGKKMESFHNKIGVHDRNLMIADHVIHEYSNILPEIFWNRKAEWLKG